MNRFILLLLAAFCLVACKQKKKKDNGEAYFPLSSFLNAQVKHVDTSLYRIVKLQKDGKGNTTTTYLKREEFHKEAAPFLKATDINDDEWNEEYDESKIMDQELNKVILSYTANEKNNEMQRADVVLQQTQDYSNVENIILQHVEDKAATTVFRNMVWYVNKRFTIVTKTTGKGQPETISTVEVIWNDFTDQ